MIVGILRLELHFPAPNFLKTKRSILKRVVERVRNKFNVSVSEVEHQNLWQRSVLGISIVGADKRFLNSVLDKVVDFVEIIDDVQLLNYSLEFI